MTATYWDRELTSFDRLLFRASITAPATKMCRGENEEADTFVINCSFVIKLYNELAQAF